MESINLTTREAMMYATLINAGIGIALGLVPLIFGIVKRNMKYGVTGFLAAIVGGAILGIFLSVPISAIFTWLIVRAPKPSVGNPADPSVGNSEGS